MSIHGKALLYRSKCSHSTHFRMKILLWTPLTLGIPPAGRPLGKEEGIGGGGGGGGAPPPLLLTPTEKKGLKLAYVVWDLKLVLRSNLIKRTRIGVLWKVWRWRRSLDSWGPSTGGLACLPPAAWSKGKKHSKLIMTFDNPISLLEKIQKIAQ